MPHVTPRRVAGTIAALITASGLAAIPSTAVEGIVFTRIAGATRYDTAVAAANDAFGTADAAVIARGDSFPDALAGSYLTGVLGAPILLTTPTDLPDATDGALDALGVETVYILGGTGAISEAVATEAAGEGEGARTVNRVAGGNRYATAAAIATGQDEAGIGTVDGKRTAFLVSGEKFADALAAGPLAHAANIPILLTPSTSLAPEAGTALEDLGIQHVIVVGGTAAISAATADAATTGTMTSQRVAGANRFATGTALADFALSKLGFDNTAVDIATGEKFADALAAGPAAGSSNRPLLLTTTASLAAEAQTWLQAHASTLAEGRIYGGTAAVSDATVAAAEAAASGEATGPQEGQLTLLTAASNTYRFVPTGATSGDTVTYADTDTFTVDGNAATVGGFETAATPGDRITHTPASGSAKASHALVNVAASSITSGVVGNVDIENTQFDIVNEVNGDALRSNLSWANVVFEIDGQTATSTGFSGDINEGDEIEITTSGQQTTFSLTNVDVTGAAADIVAGSNPVLPSTDLQIGALGDIAADDTDTHYQANGDQNATDNFTVEGASSDYDTFAEQLTAGDAVTYRRMGGEETFGLINRTPSLVSGQAVDGLDPQGAPLPPEEAGGHFSVVTDDGPVAVDYAGGGTFVVDGQVADELDFEAAYSAGDEIVYRASDAPSGTTQRVELRNRTLQGTVDKDAINTGDDPVLQGPGPNTYGVLGQDGETVLQQVEYTAEDASANTYFVNGAAVTLERFEQELEALKAGTRSGTAQVVITGTGENAVTQHRLTTTGAPITTTTTTTAAS